MQGASIEGVLPAVVLDHCQPDHANPEDESIVLNRYVCTLVAGLIVAGCANPTSSRYEGAEVGRTIETSRGTIVAGRVVDINGESNAAGPLAGAAIGGASVGLGTHSGWAAILGAVVGAGIGYATQQVANDREGIEYIVDMEDGRTVTLVQNREKSEAPLQPGTVVLVQVSGTYSRVIPRTPPLDRPVTVTGSEPAAGAAPATAPEAEAAGAGGDGGSGSGWNDPDKPATVPTSLPAPASASPTTNPQGSPSTQPQRPPSTQTQTTGETTPLVATGQSTSSPVTTTPATEATQFTASGTAAGQATTSRPSAASLRSGTTTSWAVPPPTQQ
ncbi:hypothetical protein [Defluviicoccus vanus]|uniref:Glycine zipper 2TM domain-containing protein n=1 Tax=Defluviicoccus vanus TaxID=111831 RepID=A0A7H1N270_9PROT|nr:hypothetical protein [Defluviicoccus vanus]QNT69806.1 hypothetical protein HQ394_11385 [Defluviicoccus vanus]